MRALALAALLLAGCSTETKHVKIHPFHLGPGQVDVLWMLKDNNLYRCWQLNGRPLCALVQWVNLPAKQVLVDMTADGAAREMERVRVPPVDPDAQ